MAKFTVVASGKDGRTESLSFDSAAEVLECVHEHRENGWKNIAIYRDGTFVEEMDVVTETFAPPKR